MAEAGAEKEWRRGGRFLIYLLSVQFAQEADEVLQRPPGSVDRPRHNQVEVAAGGAGAEGDEAWPSAASLGRADAFVGEGGHQFPTVTARHFRQGLVLHRLLVSRNSGVDRHLLCPGGLAIVCASVALLDPA